MTFDEYLVRKKIDGAAFKAAEPARWKEWESLFAEISEPSFTAQKLYLINPTRRRYPLKEQPIATVSPAEPAAPKPARPVMKPKMN